MKAEVKDLGGEAIQICVYDDDGEIIRNPTLHKSLVDVVHAALTEWKAKREAEKPKEPKWRAWKSSHEVPLDFKFVRFKTDIDKTLMAVACVHGCTVWIKYKSVETDLSLHGLSLFCEWSSDGATWHRCGVLV